MKSIFRDPWSSPEMLKVVWHFRGRLLQIPETVLLSRKYMTSRHLNENASDLLNMETYVQKHLGKNVSQRLPAFILIFITV